MHEISLSGSEHWAMVKLARYHTRDHRAPTWGELYTDVLMMLVTEKRAIPVMKALQHKGAIVVHNNLVMFPQYYDTYYKKKVTTPEKAPVLVAVSYQPNKIASELLRLCIKSIKKSIQVRNII